MYAMSRLRLTMRLWLRIHECTFFYVVFIGLFGFLQINKMFRSVVCLSYFILIFFRYFFRLCLSFFFHLYFLFFQYVWHITIWSRVFFDNEKWLTFSLGTWPTSHMFKVGLHKILTLIWCSNILKFTVFVSELCDLCDLFSKPNRHWFDWNQFKLQQINELKHWNKKWTKTK